MVDVALQSDDLHVEMHGALLPQICIDMIFTLNVEPFGR
jgi:hypothetical protein